MNALQMAKIVVRGIHRDQRATVQDEAEWRVRRMNDETRAATSVEFDVEDQDGDRHTILIER